MKVAVMAAGLLFAASAAAANAQPACAGHFEIIRSDQVKPGKMAVFLKAVADHQAWYAAHGLHDRILVGRLLTPGSGADGYSPTLALTVHTDMTSLRTPEHASDDAAWNAYVSEYQDSSTMVNQAIACIASPAP